MYKIIISNGAENTAILDYSQYKYVESAELEKETNTSDVLTFEIDNSFDKSLIKEYQTLVTVYDEDDIIFKGRTITNSVDLYSTLKVECEGVLSYLNDSQYGPYEFTGTPLELFESVINNHNAQVDDFKKLKIGICTVTDPNDYLPRSSTSYSSSLDILKNKLVSALGGYLIIRYEDDGNYIDYLGSINNYASQHIELRENLVDINITVNSTDISTVLIPFGATDEETGKAVDITSVNSGKNYIENTEAIAKYGRIYEVVTFENVTVPSNLLTKANAYLLQRCIPSTTIELSAVDLHMIDSSIEKFRLNEWIYVDSDVHDLHTYYLLSKIKYDLINPENNTITLGTVEEGLAGSTTSDISTIQGALSSVTNTLVYQSIRITGKLDTNVFSAFQAHIEELDVDGLSARMAELENATITLANVETLLAQKAYLTEAIANTLYANKADFDEMNTDVANIKESYVDREVVNDLIVAKGYLTEATADKLYFTIAKGTSLETALQKTNILLTGAAQINEASVISLTAQNTVIEAGMIIDAMIKSLNADKINAGNIYTNKVRIVSNDSEKASYWQDNTIAMFDENGQLRFIAGEVDSITHEYNVLVYDSLGALLFDATGVTAKGLENKIAGVLNSENDDTKITSGRLDISGIVSEINDGVYLLKSSSILFDDENQTLNVIFNQLKETVNTANQNIQENADAIEETNSDVTKLQDKFDSLEIGGRNLYLGTKNFSSNKWQNISNWATSEETYLGFVVKEKSTERSGLAQNIETKKGDIYTISFYAKVEDGGSIISIHRNITIGNATTGTNIIGGNFARTTYWADANNSSTDWKYCWATLEITQDDVVLQWRIENSIANKKISICGFKLEKGNMPTDWSPAPEDIEGTVTTLKSQVETNTTNISVANNKISLLNNRTSSIEQSVESLETDNTTNKTSISTLKNDYSSLKTTVDDINLNVGSMQQDIETIEDDVAGTKTSLTNISNQYTSLSQDVSGFKTTVSNTYATKQSVQELNDHVDDVEEMSNFIISETAPTNPTEKTKWIDISVNPVIFKIFDGEDWEEVSNYSGDVSDLLGKINSTNTTVEQNKDGIDMLIDKTTITVDGEDVAINKYVNDLKIAVDGLTQTVSSRDGNNIIRDSIGCFNDGAWTGDYNLDSTTETRSMNMYGYALLLKSGTLYQKNNVANGTYTLSFTYKNLIALAVTSVTVNDETFDLTNTDFTLFRHTFNVTSGIIELSFTTDTDNSMPIINLMLNRGSDALEWSLNPNETWSDTVKIGRGVRISSVGTDVEFVAYADIIGFQNKQGEYITTFDSNGIETNEIVVKNRATIVNLHYQVINGQTVMDVLKGDES